MTARSAAIDELIADSRQSTRLLRERRTALIAAAVTGLIDLRPIAPLDTAPTETAADIAS